MIFFLILKEMKIVKIGFKKGFFDTRIAYFKFWERKKEIGLKKQIVEKPRV